MNRLLLLALLRQPFFEPIPFDDDPEEPEEPETDPDDPEEPEGDDKKKSKSETPEALREELGKLRERLKEKNRRITELARERAQLKRQKGGGKPAKQEPKSDGGDEELSELRESVKTLTDRLDQSDAELHIEREVKRKLQPLITGGLDEEEAEDRMAAALELRVEDFMDDDGVFDPEAFLEKYPFLRSEGETPAPKDRLLGGSGKKTKSKKDWVGDRLKTMREANDARLKTRTERTKR